jgi:hypothetical protein
MTHSGWLYIDEAEGGVNFANKDGKYQHQLDAHDIRFLSEKHQEHLGHSE